MDTLEAIVKEFKNDDSSLPEWGIDFVNSTDGFYRIGKVAKGVIPLSMFTASMKLLVEIGDSKEDLLGIVESLYGTFVNNNK